MADDVKVSSFDESGYFGGPCKVIFSYNLEKEAEEGDEWVANLSNGYGASIFRILLTTLQEAVLAKASFIHVHSRRFEVVIRYRIGGRLWEANAFPLHTYAPFCARLKILFSVNIAERRVPQFGRILYEQSSFLYELRMSSIPTQQGEAFVINVLQQMGQGDYAVDRHERQNQMTVEDVLAQIQTEHQKEAI